MNRLSNIFSKKYIKKYDDKIKSLGNSNNIKTENFLLSRLFIEIVLFIVLLFIPKYGIVLSVISVILFHVFYTYFLIDNKIKIRNDKLYDEAIMFFNMLKLSIMDTNDLKTSIEVVSYKLNNSITIEFRKLLKNNRYNNDINEVLNKVINTISNGDVRTSFIDLKESNNYNETLDDIIDKLQNKNVLINKQNYQLKPFILSFISIILLSIIIVFLFNIDYVVEYIKDLFV